MTNGLMERRVIPLLDGSLAVGRDPAGAIFIDGPDVSRSHCRIERDASGAFQIVDLGSTNGTFLNGKRIEGSSPFHVSDRLVVGDATIVLTDTDRSPWPSVRETEPFALVSEDVGGDLPAASADRPARAFLKDLVRLKVISQAITSELDLDRLLNEILDAVLDFTGFQRGIVLLSQTGGQLEAVLGRKLDPANLPPEELSFSRRVIEFGLSQRDATLVRDAPDKCGLGPHESWTALGLKSALCLPLVAPVRGGVVVRPASLEREGDSVPHRLLGVLYLDSKVEVRPFGSEDRRLLRTIAVYAAIALQNAQRHQQATDEVDRLRAREAELRRRLDEELGTKDIVGRHASLMSVLEQARCVAGSDVQVLILGETGTGKERIARAIHEASPRRDKRLVKVNCAALPEALLEPELFGNEKGAFTGADKQRLGRFELAHGGTIFLDEIGDMSPAMQAKVLRVLQEGDFERVGGTKTIKVNVRVITATHKSLEGLVETGQFREDLYFRLNAVPIQLPPLRDRGDDIVMLAHHFVGRFARQESKSLIGLDADAETALSAYRFPGNVRELENMMRRAVIFATGVRIGLADLPPSIARAHKPPEAPDAISAGKAASAGEGPRAWRDFRMAQRRSALADERAFLEEAVKREHGNVAAVARTLEMNRSALHRLLTQHQIDPMDHRRASPEADVPGV